MSTNVAAFTGRAQSNQDGRSTRLSRCGLRYTCYVTGILLALLIPDHSAGAGEPLDPFMPDRPGIVATPQADCNGNGIPDDQDILSGTSTDCDGSGVPDECEVYLVESTFDTQGDLEGWVEGSDPDINIWWDSPGNPGGFLHTYDASPRSAYFDSPPRFFMATGPTSARCSSTLRSSTRTDGRSPAAPA